MLVMLVDWEWMFVVIEELRWRFFDLEIGYIEDLFVFVEELD